MDGSRRFFIFLPPSAELGRGEGRGIIFLISQGFQSGFFTNVFPVLNQVISVSRKWTWNRQKNSKISSLFLRFCLFQVYFWDKQTGDVEGSCGNPVSQPLIKKSSRSVPHDFKQIRRWKPLNCGLLRPQTPGGTINNQ